MTSLALTHTVSTRKDEVTDFYNYLDLVTQVSLRTTLLLGIILVPLFFLLDLLIIPEKSAELLFEFALYRAVATAFLVAQYVVLLKTSHMSVTSHNVFHGYLFTLLVSWPIAQMTVDLGGFNSDYYAGLNLVIIGVNLILPWKPYHSALNGLLTIFIYLLLNQLTPQDFDQSILLNNLCFLLATVIIVSALNFTRYKLFRREFEQRMELKKAKNALWGEMELAKKIQTALLPKKNSVTGYKIAASMQPASEIGGDYYDIIELNDKQWITIGDVAGHGVDSGLIMMMTQTSIQSMLQSDPGVTPSCVLNKVNRVIKENISRLDTDHYMTLSALALYEDKIVCAGAHQDILVYCGETQSLNVVKTTGTWIGLIDDIEEHLDDTDIPIKAGDIIVLFTDGVTEATCAGGNMYGDERLQQKILEYGHLSPNEILKKILDDVHAHQENQEDDITLLIMKKV